MEIVEVGNMAAKNFQLSAAFHFPPHLLTFCPSGEVSVRGVT